MAEQLPEFGNTGTTRIARPGLGFRAGGGRGGAGGGGGEGGAGRVVGDAVAARRATSYISITRLTCSRCSGQGSENLNKTL